ncbi:MULTISPECIES: hypothetical protein [Streptomyces]|uniref:Roadblock/LAMTOR2 domain-containing protein n=2 Tax=Streptomyces violaceusniger group TaxID=2839105 RepID=A0ABD5JJG1_9ACTN|nr:MULTISPECIES: hypothetical protein [Streptomyces]MEE4588581.1 hypothetical protein [Streptomyces sp. DSM 41602]RSS42996.1 hypothetical protein EF902_19370 [Streptomyces sp. WAC05858]WTA84408.1 hypothetical protein OG751_33540 [Streptomyces antimycoticus]
MQQQDESDVTLEEVRQSLSQALAEGGSRLLLRLTDEELAVLTSAAEGDHTIAASPHLEGISAQEREWVLATALRSLVSRDLIEIANTAELDAALKGPNESAQVEIDMRLSPDLDLALTLRKTADRILTLEQTTSAGTTYAYIYVHGADLLLVEEVTGGGMHTFTLVVSVSEAAEMACRLVDPNGAANVDGLTMDLDPRALEMEAVGQPLKNVIENALVVGQLILVARVPGPLLMTYATAEELWMVHVDAPRAPTGVTARSVGRQALADRIAEMLEFSA